VFDNMWPNQAAQWRNDAINRAKAIVEKVRQYERDEIAVHGRGRGQETDPRLAIPAIHEPLDAG
jgi:hypothetical protein